MSIYEPLEQFLDKQNFSEVPMTFAEIAKVLGRPLPQSAYRHRPWWANEATGHSHAKAWLNAGFETVQVDMAQQKLVFRRIASATGRATGLSEPARDFKPAAGPRRSPLFGALKGTFTIEPGYDLTRPALDPAEWDVMLEAKLKKFSGSSE